MTEKITNSVKKRVLNNHLYSNVGTIFDAYTKPSQAKIDSWEDIIDDAEDYDAITRPKVNSFNTFSYSASFEYMQEGKKRLRYYTSSNTCDFEI